jgi:2-polyprenyl-6-hydroxyphenyl methylase / 3-demethylubiquinone-9 3-methyltransferase
VRQRLDVEVENKTMTNLPRRMSAWSRSPSSSWSNHSRYDCFSFRGNFQAHGVPGGKYRIDRVDPDGRRLQFRKIATTFGNDSKEEVEKFSRMNQSWWDPAKNPLIAMNPTRVDYIQRQVQLLRHRLDERDSVSSSSEPLPLNGLNILDVGCGGGLLCESLFNLGASVTGIDLSEPLVQQASQRQSSQNGRTIRYLAPLSIQQLAQDMREKEEANQGLFDAICILEVLEHLPNDNAIQEMLHVASSMLKHRSGLLFVSTVNRTLKSYLMTILGAEYVAGLLPVGTHDWAKYRSPEEVTQLLQKQQPVSPLFPAGSSPGMELVNMSGMVLDQPHKYFTQSFLAAGIQQVTNGIATDKACTLPTHGNSIPSPGGIVSSAAWHKWRIDADDTDVNWIATYRRV